MSYSPEQQASAAAAVRPVLWARLSVNHTKKTCALSFLLPLVALVITILSGALSIDSPVSEDYVIRSDLRTRLNDARLAARDEFVYKGEGAPSEGGVAERTQGNGYLSLSILFRGRVGSGGPIGVMNETSADATNVLTREGLALMKKAEDDLFNDPEFKQFCKSDPNALDCAGNVAPCVLPDSLLSSVHLYGVYGDGEQCGQSPGSEPVSEANFTAFMNDLFKEDEGKRIVNPDFSPYMGTDFAEGSENTWIIQSYLEVGEPFKGYSSTDDREDEQSKKYDEWSKDAADRVNELTTNDIDVFVISGSIADASFGSIVMRDLSFSIVAIVLVFIVMWIHTTSAFLAGTAMAQIFLAFPFAYVFYHFVFRQLYFAALQILVIFLLLGIGADDVFVFTDAWKQAAVVLGSDCDLITRMSWTYRRAVRAMCVTSITTAAAFFVTATSPIMPISTLGVWAGVLILLQFVLVITMYPCAVIIWHRFWRVCMFINCFRKPEEGTESDPVPPLWHRCIPTKWRPEPKTAGAEEYRAIEAFFRGPWMGLVNRARYILFLLAAALVGVSIFLATRLQPPDETEQFLPDTNKLAVALTALEDSFPRSEADFQLRVAITWGITDVDRSGTSKFKPSDPGKAVLDKTFDLKRADAQNHVLRACSFFGNQTELIFQEPTIEPKECWIEDFKAWRRDELNETEFKNYASEAELIQEIINFGNHKTDSVRTPYLKYLNGQHIAFNDALDRVVFTEIRFVSPVAAATPYKVMWPVYNEWQDQLERFNNLAPDAVKDNINKAIATGGYSWLWQITQRTLVRSMFLGIGIMLAVALVALTLSTLNWAVAILATIAIGGIVTMLLGIIQLLGWKLGITESIGVVIAVGYSFDGAAHIATAYVESKNDDRFNRTRDALTDLGISILFGAVSTLVAGFMLFPAIIIFFVKFAALIVATVSLGMIWSLTFFPALLLIIGPIAQFGSLKPLLGKLTKCFRRRRDAQASDDKGDIKSASNEAPDSQEDSFK